MITQLRHVTVLGTSLPQVLQILNDGAPFNAGGYGVAIAFRPKVDADGEDISYEDVEADWVDETLSKVEVTGHDDLPHGEHRFRLVLTRLSDTAVFYAPSGEESSLWVVTRV